MSRPTAQRSAFWLAQEQTTFVGRVAELARLDAMLTTSRLATVTGTGGVGKTRLALRAAAAAEPRFADGARFAGLSGLRDPELLPNTVAAALGLPEHDPRASLDQVLDYLRDRELLLVLDTCEHLVDACALFAEAVLERTARVTILATSREPLSVAGEHEYPLAPLTVPGPAPDPGPAGLRALPPGGPRGAGPDGGGPGGHDAGDAVALFAQRAAEAAPRFAAADASRAEMARLCRHLDGIPLAIELAAVQLREISLGELTRRVELRFLDLAGLRPDDGGREDGGREDGGREDGGREDGGREDGGEPGAAARHQTLRGAIGWSYELCTPAERLLWQRLSVFAEPVSAEAAVQVCAGAGLPGETVMSTLVGLVGKSVIARGGGEVSRYRVLDTIREYGGDRLAASGAQARVRARHLRRYLALAGNLAASPMRNQVAQYRALSAEHNDIRAALEYAGTLPGSPGHVHPAVELPTKLAWYWAISGLNAESRYWLTRGLEHAPEPGPTRAAALITRGYGVAYLTDIDGGLADTGAGIAMADDAGDRRTGVRGRVYRAYILLSANRLEEAKTAAAEAGTMLGRDVREEDADLPVMLGVVRAYLELLTGNPQGCLDACELALRLVPTDAGERWGSGYLYALVGFSLCLLGQADEGNRACLRGLAMKQELGDIVGMAHCLGGAGLIAGAQKRHGRAAWLIGAADALWDKFGSVFIGVDVMQAFTDQTVADARAALGDERYAVLVRDAASRQLDQVIDVAVRDADRLPALPAGPRPAAGGR